MNYFVCKDCLTGLRVSGSDAEVRTLLVPPWYPHDYPCPNCEGKMSYVGPNVASESLAKLNIHNVTALEAFPLFYGLGLPEERDCGETAVRGALVGSVVQSVEVTQVRGHNRAVIHSITLSNGLTLHMAASGEGAVVYRIASRRSYIKEVSHE
jgi:hypothetical protein